MNTQQTTQTNATRPAEVTQDQINIGSRVQCNHYFAAAFEGQTGTITDVRTDVFGERLWTVTFDTPTPAATNWEPLKTLAASAKCYNLIKPSTPHWNEGALYEDHGPGIWNEKSKTFIRASGTVKQGRRPMFKAHSVAGE